LSYKSLINRNVAKAFSLLKDLAVSATIRKAPAKTFDFSTGVFPATSPIESFVKVIFVTEAKFSTEINNLVCTVLLKATDVVDLNTYDSVVISSVVWTLGPIISSNGFVYEVKLQRVP
jgi:hypothetical protein